jgi:hypothetical protein
LPVADARAALDEFPIMRQIVEEGVEYQDRRLVFIPRDPAPRGMAERYLDLVDPDPQIAV